MRSIQATDKKSGFTPKEFQKEVNDLHNESKDLVTFAGQ